jgi:hypothetical protein
MKHETHVDHVVSLLARVIFPYYTMASMKTGGTFIARSGVELLRQTGSRALQHRRLSTSTVGLTQGIVVRKSSTCNISKYALVGAASIIFATSAATTTSKEQQTTSLSAKLPTSGDIISAGVPVKEPSTGILFPPLCNGYYLVGTGVRVKYGFVKVYAVGTYIDPLAMSAIINSKNVDSIEQALLNPTYPRTIRIVMNRALAIDKYTSAIIESLKPRMMGQDLEKLDEFKSLNPPVDLIEGRSCIKCQNSKVLKYSLLNFCLMMLRCSSLINKFLIFVTF